LSARNVAAESPPIATEAPETPSPRGPAKHRVSKGGGVGEARFLGEIEASEASVTKVVRRVAGKHDKLTFRYEAGPTGYGLYRLIGGLGRECRVVRI
jgi:hypothetical protein